MIEINPRAVYSLGEVERIFKEVGANWTNLLPRLSLVRVSSRFIWGQHLIEALDSFGSTPPVVESAVTPKAPVKKPRRGGPSLIAIAKAQMMKNREMAS